LQWGNDGSLDLWDPNLQHAPPPSQGGGPLTGTYCTASVASVNASGSGLTMNLNISFTSVAAGGYNVITVVYDAEADEGPAQQVGSWTVDAQAVTITGIYPTSGAAGSLVTITGSNFGPGTPLVMFNGMSCNRRIAANRKGRGYFYD
jgi:hypothetical protein